MPAEVGADFLLGSEPVVIFLPRVAAALLVQLEGAHADLGFQVDLGRDKGSGRAG